MSAQGRLVETFDRTPVIKLVTVLVFAIPLALMATTAVAAVHGSLFGSPLGSGVRALFGIGGGGCTAYLGYHLLSTLWNLNLHLAVHESGFTHRVRWNAWQVGWDEVESIYRLGEAHLRWTARDGRSAVLGPLPPAAAAAALCMMVRASEKPIWARVQTALSKGEAVRFGPFEVGAETMAYRGEQWPLERVRVTVEDNVLRVDVQGGRTVFVSMAKIPNWTVFHRTLLAILVPPPYFPLVRYHGVFAARSSWRAP